MTALKPAEVEAFIARPDPKRPVMLVYGPDAGLVSERVDTLIKAAIDDPNDPFMLARLDSEELAAEPSRLVEEAQTIPLFGGRRAVWVKALGRSSIAPAVEALLDLGAFECRVVIEAGDLRRNAPLRALCERAKNAAVLPCYADDERARGRLIDDEMSAAGLKLAPDARAVLVPLLGGDRAASRNELRKLALYAHGRGQVGLEDIAAVVSDASALGIDDIVDAAFAGRPAELETHLAKARTAGTPTGSIFFAAQRQVAQLHKWRTAMESDARFSLDAVQPPLHFRRKDLIAATLKQWTAVRLLAAMTELADAVLESRRNSDLADTIAARTLLSIAVKARRRTPATSDSPD